jgi:hypothetical protein
MVPPSPLICHAHSRHLLLSAEGAPDDSLGWSEAVSEAEPQECIKNGPL